MHNQESPLQKHKLAIFLFLAITSTCYLLFKIGVVFNFWLVLILWMILVIIFFIRSISIIVNLFWYFVVAVFIFTNLIAFGVVLTTNTAKSSHEKTSDGVYLTTCTSTANDKPVALDGWKTTIYSAPLLSSSPEVTAANNINTFSYGGIKSKTEQNSLYVRVEKSDQSTITGYSSTMEACTDDNKTSLYYTASETTNVSGENVTARIHYFHGGNYLHGAGNYRVDVYIKTLDGKWHLVDRQTNITITK